MNQIIMRTLKLAVIAVAFCIAKPAEATTNEITVQSYLKVNKDAVQLDRSSGTLSIQMAGKRWNTQIITCTTTNQLMTKGSVDQCGWAYWRNLSTNIADEIHITLDAGSTTSIVLQAREPALFRLAPGATVTNFTAAANAGSVDFENTIIED